MVIGIKNGNWKMFLNFENSKNRELVDERRHLGMPFAEEFLNFCILNSLFSRRCHESAETVHVAGKISQPDFDFCSDNANRPDNQISCHLRLYSKDMFYPGPCLCPCPVALLFPVGKPGVFASFILKMRTVFQLFKFVDSLFGSVCGIRKNISGLSFTSGIPQLLSSSSRRSTSEKPFTISITFVHLRVHSLLPQIIYTTYNSIKVNL